MNALRHINITFMTTVDTNVGDEFIREGVRAALDAAGIHYRLHLVNKHDHDSISRPYRDECGVLRDKYFDTDVFIQSGAPVYWRLDDGRSTSLTSEWHQWLWEVRILGKEACAPMFINLGAGSCMPWGDDGETFVNDPGCADFTRRAGMRAVLTTVRDPLASSILTRLGVAHEGVACPAFLAGARHGPVRPHAGHIGVNLMPRGAHFITRGDFCEKAWRADCEALLRGLREKAPIVFIAHDDAESRFMGELALNGERVATSSDWRGYLDLYSSCSIVVANRVHGAVCAAGFGVPSVILGTDTRAQIADYIGIPRFESGVAKVDDVLSCADYLLKNRRKESRAFIVRRDRALNHLAAKLRQVFLEQGFSLDSRPGWLSRFWCNVSSELGNR